MITYKEDKDLLHYDDILYHLRLHNKSHTGVKDYKLHEFAYKQGNETLGYIKTQLSWDFVSIKDYSYSSKEIFHSLLKAVSTYYKDSASGIKLFTSDQTLINDLTGSDFIYIGSLPKTKQKEETLYYIIQPLASYEVDRHVVLTELEEIKKTKESINRPQDKILYVAKDKDLFVGGVYAEVDDDTLYVDLLVVVKDYRHQQIASKLMAYIEDAAIKLKSEYITLGTTSFQALGFYQKLGYKKVFSIDNYPKGFTNYTLIKELTTKSNVKE